MITSAELRRIRDFTHLRRIARPEEQPPAVTPELADELLTLRTVAAHVATHARVYAIDDASFACSYCHHVNAVEVDDHADTCAYRCAVDWKQRNLTAITT